MQPNITLSGKRIRPNLTALFTHHVQINPITSQTTQDRKTIQGQRAALSCHFTDANISASRNNCANTFQCSICLRHRIGIKLRIYTDLKVGEQVGENNEADILGEANAFATSANEDTESTTNAF
jgi:hypothetical protein